MNEDNTSKDFNLNSTLFIDTFARPTAADNLASTIQDALPAVIHQYTFVQLCVAFHLVVFIDAHLHAGVLFADAVYVQSNEELTYA